MEWATSLRTSGVLPEDELPDDFEQPVRAAAPIAAARRMLIAFSSICSLYDLVYYSLLGLEGIGE